MTEYQLTCKVASMLRAAGLRFTHVPSECPDKQRSAMQARMGVEAGVPDFLIFGLSQAAKPQARLAIELKTKTGRLSLEQEAWLADLQLMGWEVAVCRSAAEVAEVLTKVYFGGEG